MSGNAGAVQKQCFFANVSSRITAHGWRTNHVSREINYPFHSSRKNKTADSRFTKIPFNTLYAICMRDSEFEIVANAVRDCCGVGARKNQTRVSGNSCNGKQISLLPVT